MHALLVCKIFGLKIRSCKKFDKFHVSTPQAMILGLPVPHTRILPTINSSLKTSRYHVGLMKDSKQNIICLSWVSFSSNFQFSFE